MWWNNETKLIESAFNDSECSVKINAVMNSSGKSIFDQLFSRNITETNVSCTHKHGKHSLECKRRARSVSLIFFKQLKTNYLNFKINVGSFVLSRIFK